MKKNKNYIYFDEYLQKKLKDKNRAIGFLRAALEDYLVCGNREVFVGCLKSVIKAQGGITKLSKRTGLSRQALYKIIEPDSKTGFETMSTLFSGLGFYLSLEPIEKRK